MEQRYHPIHFYPGDRRTFTPEAIKQLQEERIQDVYGFKGGLVYRTTQIATILKTLLDNSNHGKSLNIDDKLASELKDILSAACYLLNSSSFRDGEYHDFDKDTVDTRLGRKRAYEKGRNSRS